MILGAMIGDTCLNLHDSENAEHFVPLLIPSPDYASPWRRNGMPLHDA